MKTCTKCGETKHVNEFCKDARQRSGLHPSCKDCRSIVIAKWQKANPLKANAKSAKWREANPEARRIYEHNRKERASGGRLSSGLSAKLFKLQRGKCACGCGKPLGDEYHLDHRMPIALGGTNSDDNMQLLRKLCNLQKSKKHPIDFMQSRGFLI